MELYRLEDVWFEYPDGTVALRGITFDIYEGDKICVIGGNGAGKTTLLLILAKLVKANRGKIFYRGVDLERFDESIFRREVGVVFQDPTDQFFNPTALDEVLYSIRQIGFSPKNALDEAKRLLKRFNLEYVADRVPHRLSFGEKKVLAFLTVYAYRPKTYLLDEPFANLDLGRIKIILEALRNELREGKTLIISTQSTEMLPIICEKVILLNDGVIHAIRDVRDLEKNEDLLTEIGLKPISCEKLKTLLNQIL